MARVGENRNAYRILVGKTEGRDQLEATHVDGRIILRWMLNTLVSQHNVYEITLTTDIT